jgi:DNA-binding beta-propeller fold protein YncE
MRGMVRRAVLVGAAAVLASAGCGGGDRGPGSPGGGPASLPAPFTVTARFSARSLGLERPHSLARGRDGTLYSADLRQRVTMISAGGRVIGRWGRRGSGPGEFRFVSGDPDDPADVRARLAVGPDGSVYVSDSGNGRVEVFTARGRYLREFGRFGSGRGQLIAPFDLVIDDDGNAYVADDEPGSLSKFSRAGRFLWRIGEEGRDPDLTGHLHLKAFDRHGRIVAANDDQARVLYLDRNGHKVDAFGRADQFPGGACEASTDAAGRTYVVPCDPGADTQVFDSSHRLVARWPGGADGLAVAPIFAPGGTAYSLTSDGTLLKLRVRK